ncbi:ammonium transporter [Pigmentiphaga sp. GD03639]|uniref:ammonium transporter n=1 Tax=unclassified Pigmentiphaga TaxID=2626614 RepID=UPI00210F56AC|nr:MULTISPECIES: ammonium transporter [unclassified Pigmentiphaga]MDH2238150.1 ammonium transporter [Pigmentiphaga sp. GD03639]
MKALGAGLALALALFAAPALAEDAAPTLVGADLAWLSTSTILVLLMVVPGLALFYGGLVRSKNMLSVLMQVLVTFSLIVVLWFIYGYSLAFTEGNAFFGGLDRLFLKGLFDADTGTFPLSGTVPELSFAAFQATFAGITCALIVGAFAERARFSAILLFMVLWFTFAYIPIAHMVWFGGEVKGFLFERGALDFAGGTVVHINAGVAGLIGAYVIGKRIGFGKEALSPHNLPMTMIGASLLWVGWFGFNAGSALAANNIASLAFMNTLIATAAAVLAWVFTEWAVRGHPSMLGGASGAVAGLVGVTPAAGVVGPVGALVIGLAAGVICVWGVTGLKRMLKVDDSLDVFGVHGVGGIVGALLTGIFNAKVLGGPGVDGMTILGQLWVQVEAVVITIVWTTIVALIAYKIADALLGLRVTEEEEREGLDITTHGESAYHS